MKINCLLFYHNMKYDPSTAPTNEILDQVEENTAKKDKITLWGYYWTVDTDVFRTERPYFIRVGNDVKVLFNPASNP